MRKKLFGNTVQPSCSTCVNGRTAPDEIMVLCRKYGPVSPVYRCKKYHYDPLRRVPKRQPKLPDYTAEDFKI